MKTLTARATVCARTTPAFARFKTQLIYYVCIKMIIKSKPYFNTEFIFISLHQLIMHQNPAETILSNKMLDKHFSFEQCIF